MATHKRRSREIAEEEDDDDDDDSGDDKDDSNDDAKEGPSEPKRPRLQTAERSPPPRQGGGDAKSSSNNADRKTNIKRKKRLVPQTAISLSSLRKAFPKRNQYILPTSCKFCCKRLKRTECESVTNHFVWGNCPIFARNCRTPDKEDIERNRVYMCNYKGCLRRFIVKGSSSKSFKTAAMAHIEAEEHDIELSLFKNYTKNTKDFTNVLKCQFCKELEPSQLEMLSHWSIFHKQRKIKCIFCEDSAASVESFSDHIFNHHVANTETVPMPCNICKKSWGNDTEFLNHVIEVHELKAKQNNINTWQKMLGIERPISLLRLAYMDKS